MFTKQALSMSCCSWTHGKVEALTLISKGTCFFLQKHTPARESVSDNFCVSALTFIRSLPLSSQVPLARALCSCHWVGTTLLLWLLPAVGTKSISVGRLIMPTTEKASKSATSVSTQQRLHASARNVVISSAKDRHEIAAEGQRPSVVAEGAKAWEGTKCWPCSEASVGIGEAWESEFISSKKNLTALAGLPPSLLQFRTKNTITTDNLALDAWNHPMQFTGKIPVLQNHCISGMMRPFWDVWRLPSQNIKTCVRSFLVPETRLTCHCATAFAANCLKHIMSRSGILPQLLEEQDQGVLVARSAQNHCQILNACWEFLKMNYYFLEFSKL